MNRFLRAGGLMLVAVLAVGTTGGTESVNVGKLEGTKWQSAYVPNFRGMSGKGMSMSLQFSEGRFSLELTVPQGASVRCGGKWRLGAGDAVHLEDISPAVSGNTSFTESIIVNEDTLTMRDPDGTTIVFTRLDPDKDKADKEKREKDKKDRLKEIEKEKAKEAKEAGPTETVTRNGKSVTKTYGP